MTSKQDGGSAFPIHETVATGGVVLSEAGMSLRDYFAAKAMQAWISRNFDVGDDVIAKWAYGMADAMIKARDEA